MVFLEKPLSLRRLIARLEDYYGKLGDEVEA